VTAAPVPRDQVPRRGVARSANRRRLLVALTLAGRQAAEVDGLRRSLGGSGLGRIDPHLTLVPPVNVRTEDFDQVLRLIRSVAMEQPVEVRLGPARTFAPRTPVVYLDVAGDTARIADLRRRLVVAPLVPAVARHERPFVPHVTIGGRVAAPRIAAALEMLAEFDLPATLSAVALCEQDEVASRHPWRVVADVVLGSGTSVGRGGREVAFVASTILDPETKAWADATPGEDVDAPWGADAGAPFVLTAYVEGLPVGVAEGSLGTVSAEVRRLRLDERRRGEGIGSQLVRSLEKEAGGRGLRRVVFLAVADGPVEGFLGHLGYHRAAVLAGHGGGLATVALARPVIGTPAAG